MGIILTPALFFEFWALNENSLHKMEAIKRIHDTIRGKFIDDL